MQFTNRPDKDSKTLQEQLQLLLALQEVDEAIAEARVRQRKLPEVVAAEKAAFDEAQALVDTAESTLAAHEKAKHDGEGDLSEHEEHLKRLKDRLKGITNTKEYQAYIQEMDGVERAVSKAEDQILQSMADIDKVNEELEALRKVRDERKEVYETERAKVDVDLGKIEEEVASQSVLREERAAAVDKTLMRRYDRVAKSMRKPVVVVNGGTCAGCNMNVPPQLVSEVKRGDSIHQCPHCHRLLHYPKETANA